MKRGKKLLIISHCIINQNSVVEPLARAKGAFPIVEKLLEEGIGLIQLPCPEFKFLGPLRKPMSKEEYDSKEFRELCRKLFVDTLEDLKKYLQSGYELKGILGIKHSPTCSIRENQGIFMEEIFSMLKEEGINIKAYDIPENYEESQDFSQLFSEIKENLDLI